MQVLPVPLKNLRTKVCMKKKTVRVLHLVVLINGPAHERLNVLFICVELVPKCITSLSPKYMARSYLSKQI